MSSSSNFGSLEKQTKQILFNLYRYFEAEVSKDKSSITTAAKLVAESTGVSVQSVQRIIAESKHNPECIEFTTPKKSQTQVCCTALDDHGKEVIKEIIQDFYNSHHEFPTLKIIQKKLKEDIHYKTSISTLRTQIKSLGFDLSNPPPMGILEVTVDG